MDEQTKRRWLDFVNKHKPTDLDIDPEVTAQLLANQEEFSKKLIENSLVSPVVPRPKTFMGLVRSHFGTPTERKKRK